MRDIAPRRSLIAFLSRHLGLGPDDLVEADLSHNDTERVLRTALKAQHPGMYCWIRDVYDNAVVYELEPRNEVAPEPASALYRRSYVVADDGAVTLGDAQKVISQTIYTPVSESGDPTPDADTTLAEVDLTGDIVPLVEKATGKDGKIQVKLIDPGWGSSGYYSPALLERDGPKVFTKGLHMFIDHPTASEAIELPERSVSRLGGVLETDAAWDANGPAGPGLYAEATPLGEFKHYIDELAPHIGVSIRASGKASTGVAEGKTGPIVEELVAAQSVDFVTRAGRGGQVLSLFESARDRAGGLPAGRSTQSQPEEVGMDERALQEAQARETQLQEQLDAATTELARLREAQILTNARQVATQALATVDGLHESTRTRLVESLVVKAPTKDGALDSDAFKTAIAEAVKAEVAYLAEVTGGGQISGMGSGGSGEGRNVEADLTSAFLDLGLSESVAKSAAAGRR